MKTLRIVCLGLAAVAVLLVAVGAAPASGQNDIDGDGVPDDLDTCPETYDPSNGDYDGDGVAGTQPPPDATWGGDACDADDDNDGVLDGEDTDPLNRFVCRDVDADTCDDCSVTGGPPDVSNDGTDTDSDGLCDPGDPCTSDPNNDADGDGICVDSGFLPPMTGDNDNCPVDYNPDQTDTDTDGFGDACDDDDDDDGICDVGGPLPEGSGVPVGGCEPGHVTPDVDNCRVDQNPNQINTDADLEAGGASVVGDSVGDVCDDDDDNDEFDDDKESWIATNPLDNCVLSPPGLGGDAWPLDNNIDAYVTVGGDVLPYRNNIGEPASGGHRRLDLNADNWITVGGDVLKFRWKIGHSCW